jgi:hypothetical protein
VTKLMVYNLLTSTRATGMSVLESIHQIRRHTIKSLMGLAWPLVVLAWPMVASGRQPNARMFQELGELLDWPNQYQHGH